MRYTEDIGKNGDYIERKLVRPRLCRCPQCRKKGKRVDVVRRVVPHVGMLNRRSWIVADVGVYKAKCECSKYFQAPIPGVPHNGRFSFEVPIRSPTPSSETVCPIDPSSEGCRKTIFWMYRWAISTIVFYGHMSRLIWRSTGNSSLRISLGLRV